MDVWFGLKISKRFKSLNRIPTFANRAKTLPADLFFSKCWKRPGDYQEAYAGYDGRKHNFGASHKAKNDHNNGQYDHDYNAYCQYFIACHIR